MKKIFAKIFATMLAVFSISAAATPADGKGRWGYINDPELGKLEILDVAGAHYWSVQDDATILPRFAGFYGGGPKNVGIENRMSRVAGAASERMAFLVTGFDRLIARFTIGATHVGTALGDAMYRSHTSKLHDNPYIKAFLRREKAFMALKKGDQVIVPYAPIDYVTDDGVIVLARGVGRITYDMDPWKAAHNIGEMVTGRNDGVPTTPCFTSTCFFFDNIGPAQNVWLALKTDNAQILGNPDRIWAVGGRKIQAYFLKCNVAGCNDGEPRLAYAIVAEITGDRAVWNAMQVFDKETNDLSIIGMHAKEGIIFDLASGDIKLRIPLADTLKPNPASFLAPKAWSTVQKERQQQAALNVRKENRK